MDDHNAALQILCRVCGQRCVKWLNSRKIPNGRPKTNYKIQLIDKFGIDVTADDPRVHPAFLCLTCVLSLNKPSTRTIVKWTQHTGDKNKKCQACKQMEETAHGRRKKPALVAKKHRREREQQQQHAEAVSSACDLLLQQPLEPSAKLQKVVSTVIKSMISSDAAPIQLATGGPKLTIQKVVTPRKASDKASARTVRDRSRQLKAILQYCSSKTKSITAVDHQLAALLLTAKSRAELQKFLHDHDLLRIRIPNGHELAMKVQLGWSWAMMRKMKIWLRTYNVYLAAESVTRRNRTALIGDVLEAETMPFFFTEEDGSKSTKLAPMVYITHVVDHIKSSLDALDREQRLTWDKIPKGEIWIKIGGDSGGGTTKFFYQICNTNNNNSRFNTTVFCVYQADETISNLHIALDRFVDPINSLLTEKWRGLTIVPWLTGDYLIQCKLLGLQGASATYPCTSCHAVKATLQTGLHVERRTLQTINDDVKKVELAGFSKDSKRRHHSVSHKPFFNIPISNVCPPGLHISLGLWLKFYNNLVNDIQQLGEVIVDELADEQPSAQQHSLKFQNHVAKVREVLTETRHLEELAEEKRCEAVDLEYDIINQSLMSPGEPNQEQADDIAALHQQAIQLDKDAKQLREKHKMGEQVNPLVQHMEETLATFKVRRQAYHSRSFVGNHVARCLKEDNYSKMLEKMVSCARGMCGSDEIHDLAASLQMKYLQLFEKFATAYQLYSRADCMTSGDIMDLDTAIEELVLFYATKFSTSSFTPKFHLLYRHTTDFIRNTGTGLGMMDEQGGEQVHNLFNVLGRRFDGVKNKKEPELAHLRAVMEEHLLIVHPQIRRVVGAVLEEE